MRKEHSDAATGIRPDLGVKRKQGRRDAGESRASVSSGRNQDRMVALARRFSEVEVLWLCLIGHGLALLTLSRMTSVLPGILCVLVMGVTQASVFVAVRPLTVLVTPRPLIGRVMAFEGPMITVASLVGGALASTLASTVLANFHAQLVGITFGPLDTLLAAAGLLIAGGGVYARLTLYRAVKQLRATAVAPQHEGAPQRV